MQCSPFQFNSVGTVYFSRHSLPGSNLENPYPVHDPSGVERHHSSWVSGIFMGSFLGIIRGAGDTRRMDGMEKREARVWWDRYTAVQRWTSPGWEGSSVRHRQGNNCSFFCFFFVFCCSNSFDDQPPFQAVVPSTWALLTLICLVCSLLQRNPTSNSSWRGGHSRFPSTPIRLSPHTLATRMGSWYVRKLPERDFKTPIREFKNTKILSRYSPPVGFQSSRVCTLNFLEEGRDIRPISGREALIAQNKPAKKVTTFGVTPPCAEDIVRDPSNHFTTGQFTI